MASIPFGRVKLDTDLIDSRRLATSAGCRIYRQKSNVQECAEASGLNADRVPEAGKVVA